MNWKVCDSLLLKTCVWEAEGVAEVSRGLLGVKAGRLNGQIT